MKLLTGGLLALATQAIAPPTAPDDAGAVVTKPTSAEIIHDELPDHPTPKKAKAPKHPATSTPDPEDDISLIG